MSTKAVGHKWRDWPGLPVRQLASSGRWPTGRSPAVRHGREVVFAAITGPWAAPMERQLKSWELSFSGAGPTAYYRLLVPFPWRRERAATIRTYGRHRPVIGGSHDGLSLVSCYRPRGLLAGTFFKGGGFGRIGDLIVGVIGAVLGGFLFSIFRSLGGGLIGSLIVATVGAVVLLFIVRRIKRA